MAFSNILAKEGSPPAALDTRADVSFEPGKGVTGSHLTVRGNVPGLSAERFAELAEQARQDCPVSQALAGTTITMDASLV